MIMFDVQTMLNGIERISPAKTHAHWRWKYARLLINQH